MKKSIFKKMGLFVLVVVSFGFFTDVLLAGNSTKNAFRVNDVVIVKVDPNVFFVKAPAKIVEFIRNLREKTTEHKLVTVRNGKFIDLYRDGNPVLREYVYDGITNPTNISNKLILYGGNTGNGGNTGKWGIYVICLDKYSNPLPEVCIKDGIFLDAVLSNNTVHILCANRITNHIVFEDIIIPAGILVQFAKGGLDLSEFNKRIVNNKISNSFNPGSMREIAVVGRDTLSEIQSKISEGNPGLPECIEKLHSDMGIDSSTSQGNSGRPSDPSRESLITMIEDFSKKESLHDILTASKGKYTSNRRKIDTSLPGDPRVSEGNTEISVHPDPDLPCKLLNNTIDTVSSVCSSTEPGTTKREVCNKVIDIFIKLAQSAESCSKRGKEGEYGNPGGVWHRKGVIKSEAYCYGTDPKKQVGGDQEIRGGGKPHPIDVEGIQAPITDPCPETIRGGGKVKFEATINNRINVGGDQEIRGGGVRQFYWIPLNIDPHPENN